MGVVVSEQLSVRSSIRASHSGLAACGSSVLCRHISGSGFIAVLVLKSDSPRSQQVLERLLRLGTERLHDSR